KIKNLNNNWGLVSIGVLLVLFAIISSWLGFRYIMLSYPLMLPVGGIGLLLISVGYPCIKLPKWLLVLSTLSYGVYLSHVIFLEIFEFFIEKMFAGKIYIDLGKKIILVSCIFISSAAFSLIIRKNSIARKLLLGEK